MNPLQLASNASSSLRPTGTETLSTAAQPISMRGGIQDPMDSQMRAFRGSSLPPEPAASTGQSSALPTPSNANNLPIRATDIIWRNYGNPDATINGSVSFWSMNGTTPTGTVQLPSVVANRAWEIAGAGDFNNDGHADLLWRNYETTGNDAGEVNIWMMNGNNLIIKVPISLRVTNPNWRIEGVGDFNGDGRADILWRNYDATGAEAGLVNIWTMNNETPTGTISMPLRVTNLNWRIDGVGDFNNDGKTDIVWRNYQTSGAEAGLVNIWTMNGVTPTGTVQMPIRVENPNWRIEGTGDFNNDGKTDIVWRNYDTSGAEAGLVNIWTMDGVTPTGTVQMPIRVTDPNWRIDGVRSTANMVLPPGVTRITNTSDWEGEVQISGSNIAWTANEVFLYNGTTGKITQLTNNDLDGSNVRISGLNVVWQQQDRWGKSDIYFYDGTSTRQLTNNPYSDYGAIISGNQIAWISNIDIDPDPNVERLSQTVFTYTNASGITPQPVSTDLDSAKRLIGFSGSNLIWLERNDASSTTAIRMFDPASQTSQVLATGNIPLLGSSSLYGGAQVSGSTIVWESIVGPGSGSNTTIMELFALDLNTNTTTKIVTAEGEGPSPFVTSLSPRVSGNNIVWTAFDGNDTEVFLWNGTAVQQLTNNSIDERYSMIDGSNVVWIDESTAIYRHNSSGTVEIGMGSVTSIPVISGNNVAWASGTGIGSNPEIFLARI